MSFNTQQAALQKRDPKCWQCSYHRKACFLDPNNPDENSCQRCRSMDRECTNHEPLTKPPRLNKLKCDDCRRRKQLCTFSHGPWPAKCQQCQLHGLECSEPKETKLREARKLRVMGRQLANKPNPAESAQDVVADTSTANLPQASLSPPPNSVTSDPMDWQPAHTPGRIVDDGHAANYHSECYYQDIFPNIFQQPTYSDVLNALELYWRALGEGDHLVRTWSNTWMVSDYCPPNPKQLATSAPPLIRSGFYEKSRVKLLKQA